MQEQHNNTREQFGFLMNPLSFVHTHPSCDVAFAHHNPTGTTAPINVENIYPSGSVDDKAELTVSETCVQKVGKMSSRRTGPSLLDKNVLFLNTKGLCLLCYEECPVKTLDKRQETTQTSVNFLRLVSRYLGFNAKDVVAEPLKKVGQKCDKDTQNDKNFDKVGFELCDRCASLAQAFCQVQFQVQFHQMILERCVRSISEIIKDANKKSAAELFTLSEDAETAKKQQKTFTRLSTGGIRSATVLRNKLYKRSIQKLASSFPVIKLKRICKSGDWIHLLNKDGGKDKTENKNSPADSKDTMIASLLGCVVSLWLVISLSFLNPEDQSAKNNQVQAKTIKKVIAPVNCDALESELKLSSKKSSETQEKVTVEKPADTGRTLRPRKKRSPSTTDPNWVPPGTAQQRSQRTQPPATSVQPIVVQKHSNRETRNKAESGSQCQIIKTKENEKRKSDTSQTDPALASKTKPHHYPAKAPQSVPPNHTSSARAGLPSAAVVPPSNGTTHGTGATYPTPHYPNQQHHTYSAPHPSHHSTNYASTYPTCSSNTSSSLPVNHYASHVQPSTSSIPPQSYNQEQYQQNSNYNYSYNYTSYNYSASSSSSWPSYNNPSMDHGYTPSANGGYDPYYGNMNGSGEGNFQNNSGYDYGYDYNYGPPQPHSQHPPTTNNSYHHHHHQQQQTETNSYNMHTPLSGMTGMLDAMNSYPEPCRAPGSGNDNESASYTTLLPPAPVPMSHPHVPAPPVSVSRSQIPAPPMPVSHSLQAVVPPAFTPMEVDNTNTSTSDEPSLTHEDPQVLDSENSSMNGEDSIMESEHDIEAGASSQSPQIMFPECHWRQNVNGFQPIFCKKPGCTEQFITPIQLTLHLRTHGEFHCSFCHLTFSKAHNLAQHEKMRHCRGNVAGKNKCPRCDYTSTSQYNYFLHFLSYHLRIQIYEEPCDICNKPFVLGTKSINRKNHFKTYHDSEGKDPASIHTCKGCSAPFLKDAQLRDHQQHCTAIGSVSSTESVDEIDYNTALATAGQIIV